MRNRVLLNALCTNFEVTVLTPDAHSTIGRLGRGVARLLYQRPRYDICFAGFYGQPLAIALSVLQRMPIILDAYVSTFDTLCQDRRWFRPRSPVGRLARWADTRGCKVSTRVLTDTHAHARYFAETFGIPQSKFRTVYVGCDERLFFPRDNTAAGSGQVEVFYYGAFLPLHGTEVIVQAAHLLRDQRQIHFTIGGDGPRHETVRQKIAELGLSNVDLVGWILLEDLPEHIGRATICLGGHFSDVPKAARVVSTKTFQFVAMRKPTIVGDNPATRELFTHGQDVYAVPMNDATALAEAILRLGDDTSLRDSVAASGYQLYAERLGTHTISEQLAPIIQKLAGSGQRAGG